MIARTFPVLGAALIANVASAATLTATGVCPGQITIDMQNFTANGQFALLAGNGGGNNVIPNGPCQGTPTQLGQLAIKTTGNFNAGGDRTIVANIPAGACAKSIQVLDVTTCNVSNLSPLGSQCVLPNVPVANQGPTGNMADPTFFGVFVSGIVENGRARDLTIDQAGAGLIPTSAELDFQFLDANFGLLCTIRYDLSGAVVDNAFSTVLGGPFVDPMSLTLTGGDSDCGRVSSAVFGTQDLRAFLATTPWSVAFGPMQNQFAQDLENAVVASGQNFTTDWEPFVFSTYVTTTGTAASEIDYTFRFDRTCDLVEADNTGTLVDLLGTVNGPLDDFALAQPFLVFNL